MIIIQAFRPNNQHQNEESQSRKVRRKWEVDRQIPDKVDEEVIVMRETTEKYEGLSTKESTPKMISTSRYLSYQ